MTDFDRAFEIVVGLEGGYVNDPNDPGGETKFGISKRAYPNVDIKNLSLIDAKDLYWRDYWVAGCCDIYEWPMSLFVFDASVNQGVNAGATLAQKHGRPAEYLTARALRYTQTKNFDRYGRGWFNRLFKLALESK